MRLTFQRALILAGLAVVVSFMSSEVAESITPEQKLAGVRARRAADARGLVRSAGLSYPPRRLLLRAFKGDGQMELWARGRDSDIYRLLKIYPICARSGGLGPKRREGDLQVPEGIYRVVHFNPASSFHLSMGIDYPNASDRVLSDPKEPGSNIYIHGGCATIGCIPIGNEGIEEVYLIGADVKAAGGKIDVHLFPCRTSGAVCRAEMTTMAQGNPELKKFWSDLDRIQAAFDRDHKLPAVTVDEKGRYLLGD